MLEVNNLQMIFQTDKGPVRAVNDVSFKLNEGERLALVGESGCGKSATLLSLLQLIPYPGKITAGEIKFQGRNLLTLPIRELRKIRGKEMAMIFQDPMTTLNPVFKVGEQIRESLRLHEIIKGEGDRGIFKHIGLKKKERQRVKELMVEVGIPSPEDRYWEYPHQFSGGMQQRALIAIALSCEPKILLADEPTTALDVTIQAQILRLMERIVEAHKTGIIFVTHDLGVAAQFCQRVAVMYAGQIVEMGTTEEVINNPSHPYTKGLLRSIPRLGNRQKLKPIKGNVIDFLNPPPGCPFEPRCEEAKVECRQGQIPLSQLGAGRQVRCLKVCGGVSIGNK